MREIESMNTAERFVVSITQDNYGRWFVEAKRGHRKLAPIRCLTEAEARDRAAQLSCPDRRSEAA
jgi:hypothetical protein